MTLIAIRLAVFIEILNQYIAKALNWITYFTLYATNLFQDNVYSRKVQGLNIISCFRKYDVLMKYALHIKEV